MLLTKIVDLKTAATVNKVETATADKIVPQNKKKLWIFKSFWNMCRKSKRTQTHWLPPQQTNVNQIETTFEKDDIEELVNKISSYRELYNQVYDSPYNSDSEYNNIADISSKIGNKLQPIKAKIHLGNFYSLVMIDFGSLWNINDKSLENNILTNTSTSRWINTKDEKV